MIAIAACLLCALIGFAMGYLYGVGAARRTNRSDKSKWTTGKPPSAVDD
jgi:hypothetical protein